MENEKNAAVEKPTASNGMINLFALTNSFQSMAMQIPTLYLTMFMTDYLHINPVAIGTAMLIAKIFDFVVSLFAGVIIEKVNMKHGKYLSWLRLLTVTVFFGNSVQMLDTTAFIENANVRLLIVCIFYIMFHSSMNFSSAARGAIIPKLAGANQEVRKKITARQTQLRSATSIISSAITLPCVQLVQRMTGNDAIGYFIVAVVFGLCYVVTNVIFCKLAAPFDPPEDRTVSRKNSPSIKQMFESVVTNKQMLILFSAFTIATIGNEISSGVTTYFFRATDNFSRYTLLLTCRSVATLVAAVVAPSLGRKLGKKGSVITAWILRAAVLVLTYLFGINKDGTANFWLVLVCQCLGTGSMSLYTIFTTIYYLDCGEYGYYTTGIDNRTMAVTVMNWPTKIAKALGGSMATFGLAWAGYVAPATKDALPAFTNMSRYMALWQLLPAVCMLISALIIAVGYKLTDKQAAEYARANAEREAAAKA